MWANPSDPSVQRGSLGRVLLVLRLGVAVQCAALAWLALEHGTSLDAALFMVARTTERTAVLADRGLAAVAILAALLVVLRPSGRLTRVGALLTSAIFLVAALATRAAGGSAFAWLAPVAHATRWLAPVALAALALPGEPSATDTTSTTGARASRRRVPAAAAILRFAIAATFCAHGWQALGHDPAFVDLLLGSARRWTGGAPTEAAAETVLTAIGVLDVAVALALLVSRWPAVAAWATVWGLVTLASRTVALGTEFVHESLLRAMNGLAPMALWWLTAARTPGRTERASPR